MGQVLWLYLYLSQNIFYHIYISIILQFEEPLFILITFIKLHCIFVLKKLHFAVFMGESLSPMYIMSTILFQELQVTNTDLLFAITVSHPQIALQL